MTITKKEIRKHINECKRLLKGEFHRINYNRQWDIVVQFYWTSDDSVDFQFELVRKNGGLKYIIFNDMLTCDILDKDWDKIDKKIKKSKQYKAFRQRIKDECKWGNAYDKASGGNWYMDVLNEAENEVVYHYET